MWKVHSSLCAQVLKVPPAATLHIGDQFLNTGNDHAARACCPCIWVTSPRETRQVIKEILREALQLPNAELKETNPAAAAAVCR